ncbi:MAG TPA: PAS domain-containing protein, partial [Baekduia sp.]|nr:PAS domain-containing protein [Baekduia sp.]
MPAEAWSRELDEAELRAVVRTFSDWVWKADPDGGLTTDMPEWRAITGQTPDELLGAGWVEGVHPGDRDRVAAAWQAAVDAQGVYDVEYRVTGPGGERWYAVRAAPVLDDAGDVDRWVGTARDVTARHEAVALQEVLEADLARQRALLQQVIDQAPTAVAVLWGSQHEFRYFNERYLDIVPRHRVRVGRTVRDALPEAEGVIAVLDRVLTGETVRFEELALPFEDERSFDGHRFYQVTYSPVLVASGPGGVLAVATEVTEQVRRRHGLAEQVRQERQAAERLQRALLPERSPSVPGLDIALAYLPAGEDVGVGGDWYDVVELGGDEVLLVIGDICGRGMEAAAYMSQVRAAVRAYAVVDPSPASILDRCAALVQRLAMPDMITVGIGLLDRADGRLVWAGAGHLPPLVLPVGGEPRFVDLPGGPPLGAGPGYAERPVTLG